MLARTLIFVTSFCNRNPLGFAVREQNDELNDSIAILKTAGALPDLEVAMICNDLQLAKDILSENPQMTDDRIRSIRDVAENWPAPSFSGILPPGLTTDRMRFVTMIDNWLASR